MGVSTTTSGSLRAEAAALIRRALAGLLDDAQRPIRLRLAEPPEGRGDWLDGLLLVQRIEIHEAVFDGLTAHVTCLSVSATLPLEAFIGLPIEIQLVTDRGRLRRFCCIVTEARAGRSDGGLAVFQLTGRDALGVMAQRINSRVFRHQSVAGLSQLLLREWLQLGPGLARAFDFDLSRLSPERYPPREFTMQHNESDAAFLRRSWRRAGIGWLIQPGPPGDAAPRHRLILFDDAKRLDANAAGELHYQRDAATQARDGITQWSPVRMLVPGRAVRKSWDYRAARVLAGDEPSILDQGAHGNEVAAALHDSQIEMPHAGDSLQDHHRLTRLRMLRHEFEGSRVQGVSGVRDLAAGEWNRVAGHVSLEGLRDQQREYLVIEVRHDGENNLPKPLDERAQGLLPGCLGLPGWQGGQGRGRLEAEDRRYQNRFTAVRRDVPVVPDWQPQRDLPATPPLTAVVVGPPNEEVYCDALGRVKVQFQGLEPADHAHAQGAGTEGAERDSAWLRVNFGWAGADFGNLQPLRVGMEVEVSFLGGDPDRPLITGVLYNGRHPPPSFSHLGELPGNRYLSGTKTREIGGRRCNQLRFDDTPGQISAQLASEHGESQLNLGYLTHPRSGGVGEARGEGFELRSDESGAIRTAKGLLLSAWQRLNASDGQLARDDYIGLMEQCLDLFKSLGQYAAAHEGLPSDTQPQADLKNAIEGWEAGSNTDPKAALRDPAAVGITAPQGISLMTPKTIVAYAGVNLDSTAQQHLQFTAGQRCNVNAGQGVGLFAHDGGIRAIAHQGPLVLQSQYASTSIDSAQDMTLRAVGDLTLMARNVMLIAEDGSFIKVGGGINQGTQGAIAAHASSHSQGGPQTLDASKPSFAKGEPDAQFVLRFDPRDPNSGIAAQHHYRITLSDGSVIEGVSDEEGRTRLTQRQSMHMAALQVFKGD